MRRSASAPAPLTPDMPRAVAEGLEIALVSMSTTRGKDYASDKRTDRLSLSCRVIAAIPLASADRTLHIESIRDKSGREMRVPDTRVNERTGQYAPRAGVFPFGDPGYFGHRENDGWPTNAAVAIDHDSSRVVSEIDLNLEMFRAEKIVPIDRPITEAATVDFIELVQGVHALISKVEPQASGKIAFEMCVWLHNKHPDISTMTPVVRTEADVRAGRNERRQLPPGNDVERAPYLYSVELVDKHGRVLDYISRDVLGLTHWTGQYWYFKQEFDPIKGGAAPETLRIQLVTEVARSTIPFTFTGLAAE